MFEVVGRGAGGGGCRGAHKPARPECACLLGADVGAYNACGHGCIYCYANHDQEAVCRNMAQHDPGSPLLIGHVGEDDQVRDARQTSWIDLPSRALRPLRQDTRWVQVESQTDRSPHA